MNLLLFHPLNILVRHSCVTQSGRESRSDSIYLCPFVQSVARIEIKSFTKKFELRPVGTTKARGNVNVAQLGILQPAARFPSPRAAVKDSGSRIDISTLAPCLQITEAKLFRQGTKLNGIRVEKQNNTFLTTKTYFR